MSMGPFLLFTCQLHFIYLQNLGLRTCLRFHYKDDSFSFSFFLDKSVWCVYIHSLQKLNCKSILNSINNSIHRIFLFWLAYAKIQ